MRDSEHFLYQLATRELAALRKRRGESRADLGKRVGVTRQVIAYMERGRSRPSLLLLGNLCEQMDVDPAEFYRYLWSQAHVPEGEALTWEQYQAARQEP